ncbi:MAG: glycosyltransferase family 2 protein [Candidatus Marinimicrobia bacterium]|nr:glycosyltransferase family 2 protein [Candidatus Neomarinimicrobiota bacterium]MBT3618421.1 glycosyltransferase family 2 protein [Candidatus Neomarinimicrobiota bacterium]MBT3829708.1 glycosyltransferase family 2 protein [Candidatus Neomarinimicrobiota bacterium]MBT3997071.1 glycosyltransferase family 2 protein [Candidatus Neomarinimicrobiota bacterium]MBT4280669.1 glycosyltransferase family 2 protein [Candidatus Neomarinimicrobiota bacterium]
MMQKSITIIIPVFNEVDSLKELQAQLENILENRYSYEILYMNDGSFDGSEKILDELSNQNASTKAVHFHRNYGKAAALAEGFKLATGDYVMTMDADLQDDPAEIPNFITKLEEGFDLVSGWKKDRKDPLGKTMPSRFFNFVTRLMTGVKIHDFNCGIKMYKNAVVKTLDIYGGRHRYIPALAGQKNFKVSEIIVNHRPRIHGETKYGGGRLFHGFFDLLTILFLNRYTQRPLHLFGFFGLFCILIATGCEMFTVYDKLVNGIPFQQHFALIVFGAMVFVLGLWFFSIGLIAEMIVAGQQGKEDRVKNIVG